MPTLQWLTRDQDLRALVESQIEERAREFKRPLWDEVSKLCHFSAEREGHRILVG